MTQNRPLRHPVDTPSATPTEGMLYVTSAGAWKQYVNKTWQDVEAASATKLTSRTLSLTGDATGSTTTDWSSNPTISGIDVAAANHGIQGTPMVLIRRTDNTQTIGQNAWTQVTFNSVVANDYSMFNGSGTITLTQAGYYLYVATCVYRPDTDNGRRLAELRVGSGYAYVRGYGATNSNHWGRSMGALCYSSGSTTLELWTYMESAGVNIALQSAFIACWRLAT